MSKPMTRIFPGLAAIALLQTLVLGWMVWDRVSLLRYGQEVKLAVVPVDPRDLLRGDYIILRFGISRLDTGKVETDRSFKRNDVIFVGLKKFPDGLWNAVSASHQRPLITSDLVFIRGKVNYPGKNKNGSTVLAVTYGMEKYFIPEGDGRKLEKYRNDKVLTILATVSNTGEAGIKALLLRGKVIYDEPYF